MPPQPLVVLTTLGDADEARAFVRRLVDERRVALAIQDLMDLPIVRCPHAPFAWRLWELRENVTPYDAAYVALAEALGCALVTGDERLSKAPGVRCAVEVLRAG